MLKLSKNLIVNRFKGCILTCLRNCHLNSNRTKCVRKKMKKRNNLRKPKTRHQLEVVTILHAPWLLHIITQQLVSAHLIRKFLNLGRKKSPPCFARRQLDGNIFHNDQFDLPAKSQLIWIMILSIFFIFLKIYFPVPDMQFVLLFASFLKILLPYKLMRCASLSYLV